MRHKISLDEKGFLPLASKLEDEASFLFGPPLWRNLIYFFFVDFIGHPEDPNVAGALTELNRACAFSRLLGSYPESTI